MSESIRVSTCATAPISFIGTFIHTAIYRNKDRKHCCHMSIYRYMKNNSFYIHHLEKLILMFDLVFQSCDKTHIVISSPTKPYNVDCTYYTEERD